MYKLKALVAASFIILVASCSLPDTSGAQRMMEKYWQFCKDEQYDSLKHFYLEDRVSESQLNQLFTSLHDMREKYGSIKKANNFHIGVNKSLGGEGKVELSYQVIYENKILEHTFTFKELKHEEFRITDHSWTMDQQP